MAVQGTEAPTFRSMTLSNWRQFGEVALDFHPRLTILTGPNGSGKTSILNLLNMHFAWNLPFAGGGRHRDQAQADSPLYPGQREIGQLTYTNDVVTPITVPSATSPQFNVGLPQVQTVTGLAIPSHRMISGYQPVSTIPASFSAGEQLLQTFLSELRTRYMGTYSARPPSLVMKESLLAAQMYGEGSPSRAVNDEARTIWVGFQQVLTKMLPDVLGFRELRVDPPEVLLVTDSGTFPLDAMSGGVSALFELSWQIFLQAHGHDSFTVCFDEPENHLHPEMQRAIIPGLLEAFPRIRFIVATHSPFVVTAVPDAAVYALTAVHGQMEAVLLRGTNLAASSDDTLRDVLGLDSTLPKWAERRLDVISQRFAAQDLSASTVQSLRRELEELGLGREYPATLAALIRRSDATAD